MKSSNIQRYQIEKKDKEFSKELLKTGQNITSYEVNKKVNEFFEHKIPGLPYYKPYNFERNVTSDPEHFNGMFRNLKEDLSTIYDVYNMQLKENIIYKENCDSEIIYLNKEIDNLILQSEILEEYSKKRIAYHPYIINFFDLGNTNTKDLTVKNIPKSTCEIDFDTSTLRNKMHSFVNDKINLLNSEVKIESDNLVVFEDFKKDKLFDESENSILNFELESMSKFHPTFYVTIKLDSPAYMSRIDLKASSIVNANVKLYLSEDGTNYLEKEEVKGSSFISFKFNKQLVSSFKIQIKKDAEDLTVKGVKQYFYSLINISAYNDKYEKDSVYVSNVISFEPTVSDIVINPIHSTPPLTDISYFVAYEDKNDKATWFKADINKPIDLGILNKQKKFLNYDTSKVFGHKVTDELLGDTVFKIYELEENTSINSIDLRAGLAQWFVEKLSVTPTDNKANPKDYNKANVKSVSALDSTISEIKCEDANNYVVLSKYAICDKETIIEDRFMEFNVVNEKFHFIVLINGKQVFPKENKYSFKLKKGENTIQIMFVLNNLNVSNLETIKTIKHNFNILPLVKEVYAGPKMRRISYNSLIKNISNHSLKYYAVKNIAGKDVIVTKFDPNYVVKPTDPRAAAANDTKTNNSEYMRMMVEYKYLKEKERVNITNKDGECTIRVRIMARLTSNDISTTPSIRAIKVVAE